MVKKNNVNFLLRSITKFKKRIFTEESPAGKLALFLIISDLETDNKQRLPHQNAVIVRCTGKVGTIPEKTCKFSIKLSLEEN